MKAKVENATAGGLSAEQAKFWDEFTSAEGMKIQEDEALAESWFLKARSLLHKGRFPEAKEAIDKPSRHSPYHQAAQRLRQDIYGILDRRNDRLGMASDWLAAIGAVSQQEKAVEMHNLLERGDKQFNAGFTSRHSSLTTVLLSASLASPISSTGARCQVKLKPRIKGSGPRT